MDDGAASGGEAADGDGCCDTVDGVARRGDAAFEFPLLAAVDAAISEERCCLLRLLLMAALVLPLLPLAIPDARWAECGCNGCNDCNECNDCI
jgi:hypothetical protein